MWSEDPGTVPTAEEENEESRTERASVPPLRWFFGFDGWRVDVDELYGEEFVLG